MREQSGVTENKAADAGGRVSGWTTRRWLRVGVGVTLAVLAVLGGLGAWSMSRASQLTTQVVDTSSPALIDAVRLEAALVNQETGIRGYGLSGQRDFLDPYHQGVTDEKDALRRLRPLIKGDDLAAKDLAEVEKLALPVAAAHRPPGGRRTHAAPRFHWPRSAPTRGRPPSTPSGAR